MQRQESLRTIQGTIEEALADSIKPRSLSEPILQVSSRTDSGVHALSTTAHIDLIHPKNESYNTQYMKHRLNKTFAKNGHAIRITSCYQVSTDFHARHSAKSRSYLYRLMVPKKECYQDIPVSELYRCFALLGNTGPFDAERVKRGTQLFLGPKDFQTFAGKIKNKYQNKKVVYVRQLDYFTVEKGQPLMIDDPLSTQFDYWDFRCGGRAFLYNQVRRMVGTLITLGLGKITERDIRCMLQVPSRHNWDSRVQVLPPYALYLCEVGYDPLDLKKNIICEDQSSVAVN
ncbi:tRNA pseudouridine synthase A isoform X2 [Neodiprion pinetum]|nr:tRNA pseudouridine synthase A isoform X2 [Neodiprion fabricii]XP_046470460.1 tRNA pseudouridine synthase A isoform X2 [Neodiprion pinetum]XP_046606035.1 tRNA pseudouridine synthase A isoform X2 [Neodiprion virginianus]